MVQVKLKLSKFHQTYPVKSAGFTIVEIVITLMIMGILLSLAVVNVDSTQRNARDVERRGDIEAIQLSLEDYYKSEDSRSYPSTALPNGSVENMRTMLKDISIESLKAPGIEDPNVTFIAAETAVQTTSGATSQPITKDQYVYQPLYIDDTNVTRLCEETSPPCRKYNLYYRLEGDDTVYMVTSRHQ